MLRKFAFVALLLSVVGCGSSLSTPVRSSSSAISHMGSSTVALVFTDEDGDVRPFCTGVWLSDDEILTAGHCAAAMARHNMKLEDEDPVDPVDTSIHYIVEAEVDQVGKEPTAQHLAFVKAWDEDHDLALVKAVGNVIPAHEHASLAGTLPGLGERVRIVGHPKGYYWTYVEGVVAAYRDMEERGKVVQVSAPVWFGNSGGGVFDSSGHLIGIASFLVRMPNTSFFIHEDSIKKFLHDLAEKEAQHAEQKALAQEKK